MSDFEKDLLLKEIEELKKSNERLEKAFIAISKMLELQLELSVNNSLKESFNNVNSNNNVDPLKLEFERKLKKNKSRIVKNKILEVLDFKGLVELSDLKFLIVDQLHYTTKPSFYRYVKELELEKVIEKNFLGNKTFIKLKEKNIVDNKQKVF